MNRNPEVFRKFNAFLKHAKGKCPIIAYITPLVPAVKCIIKHRLASGIGYYHGFDGREVGDWFRGRAPDARRGPGGVRYQRFPDWEEVAPPGEPIPEDAPAEYLSGLPEESVELIKKAGLFFYAFLNYDPDEVVPRFLDVFGERFIPGLVMEANHHFYPGVAKAMSQDPEPNRDKAYRAGRDRVRAAFESNYPYGLSGSGVEWYQAAGITKQKRWDHEVANGNFQVQLAFLRGVSQQYDIPFITYVAPMGNSPEGLWGTKVDPDTPFGKVLNCTYFSGGKPDHLLEREWFQAWFSGSAAVVMEAADFYLFRKGKDKSTFEPGCMAEAMKKLNYLAYESDFERGTPCRPGCILMDERHGWDFPCAPDAHNWDPPGILARKIWGFFDYTHQDLMVDNFFGAVYPGYELGGAWGCEPGDLVQTPYGESFDVLMSNAGLKALQKYPVLFPIGQPKLTKAYKAKLEQYVSRGGTLVLNISQVDCDWQQFLGVRFSPKFNRWYKGLGTLRASDRSEWLAPNHLWNENRYHYSRIEATKAKVLAVTEQGDPLVVCRELGKGKVYLVTAHFMQEISGHHRPNGLLNISKFLIGQALLPHQRVRVRGPHIDYLVNDTKEGLSVMLLNNSGDVWSGWVTLPGMAKATVREWYAGARVHSHRACGDLSVRLSVPGNGLRLLAVTRK